MGFPTEEFKFSAFILTLFPFKLFFMQALFDFFVQTQKLKEVKRSGWALRGIKNGEHVSDHSFSVALMAYVFAKRKGLNEEKAIKMALVHDVFEVLTGDIPTRLKNICESNIYIKDFPSGWRDPGIKRDAVRKSWARSIMQKKPIEKLLIAIAIRQPQNGRKNASPP